MKIQFLGGAQTVTGSRTLIRHHGKQFLVDCGLFQGFKHLRLRNWEPLPVPARDIDAVLLTHAHLDHSGYIPLLVKNGFRGKIFATRATRKLAQILLRDSGYLQEEEAKYANKKGFSKHTPAEPLYTQKDAERAMEQFVTVDWKTPIDLGHDLRVEFHPAGHLLGASSLWLHDGRTSVTFSGDVGRYDSKMLRPPEFTRATDFLVLESTYGNRLHDRVDPKVQLKEIIDRTISRGGVIVIPSFAVGRAQEILYFLNELRKSNQLPNVPVYLNSPMASETNQVLMEESDETILTHAQLKEICGIAKVVSSADDSIKLNEKKEPMIIIAASGMATGGRVLHHIKAFAPDERNTLLFAGFQAGGTRGEAIVHGARETKIHGEFWPIRAEVIQLESLSGHADQEGLLGWISKLPRKPRKVILNHGEESASDSLRHEIQKRFAIDTIVAEHLHEYDLS
jgi:metallo-beta-lactamase family protein